MENRNSNQQQFSRVGRVYQKDQTKAVRAKANTNTMLVSNNESKAFEKQ
ncbi:hypothetical protein MWU65_05150 [Cellulophaga sp. F20128]|nr:hypothetical protein [Cellulophaga sp. F20128]MCK0156555.1 hypothetical protein [Cellulophaga sp. F20128]